MQRRAGIVVVFTPVVFEVLNAAQTEANLASRLHQASIGLRDAARHAEEFTRDMERLRREAE